MGQLFTCWQQADHVVAARYGKRAVERNQATAMSARQAKEIRSVICFPVLAVRTSGMTAGETASGQNT